MAKRSLQSYISLLTKRHKQNINADNGASITNDNTSPLANEYFFLPKFSDRSILYYLLYIAAWVIFSNVLFISLHHGSRDFFFEIVREFVFLTLTIFPSLFIIDSYRPWLKRLVVWQVCAYVILLLSTVSIFAMIIVSVMLVVYLGDMNLNTLIYDIFVNSISIAVLTIFVLIYYLYQHIQRLELKQAFELHLASQNELFNARMSPHFFFNTINGLTSLVESNPKQAVAMLANISTLFRASFKNSEEISMEQEVQLCQVFLQIDEMRFHGKLNVSWDLPDEDLMYDMVITGLTLQRVLEKLLHHVVELTTENIDVNIAIAWEHHQVSITIEIKLPVRTLLIRHDLVTQINFDIQEQRLKQYFGEESSIIGRIIKNKINVVICYPLHDPGIISMDHDDNDLGDNINYVNMNDVEINNGETLEYR